MTIEDYYNMLRGLWYTTYFCITVLASNENERYRFFLIGNDLNNTFRVLIYPSGKNK